MQKSLLVIASASLIAVSLVGCASGTSVKTDTAAQATGTPSGEVVTLHTRVLDGAIGDAVGPRFEVRLIGANELQLNWKDAVSKSCGRAESVVAHVTTRALTLALVPHAHTANNCQLSARTYSAKVKLPMAIDERKILVKYLGK